MSLLTTGCTVPQVEDHCSKGPNRVRVSLLQPEDGNRSRLRNSVFVVLKFRTMDIVQKASGFECVAHIATRRNIAEDAILRGAT
jgi:hypothetical protein